MARQGTKAGAGRASAVTTCRDTGRLLGHSSCHPCRQLLPDDAPCRQVAFQSCCSGSLQGTRCRVSRGAATLPHRLPLRSIPPQRFACGSSHSRGHGRPRSVRKSSRLRWKRSICQIVSVHWIAAAQTDANLSAHLHRLPTPPPCLRRMRMLPGRGADIGCRMRLALCQ